MPRTIHKTEQPVILEGYQAVLKPSKFGYSLSAIVDSEMVDALETDREESLQWAQGKLKNPKRSVLKPEPWEEVADNQFKVKFSWNEENRPQSHAKYRKYLYALEALERRKNSMCGFDGFKRVCSCQ